MSKLIIRDGVAPATVYNPHISAYEPVYAGRAFDADDPFVGDHPELFDAPVERATAAPGEKRNTRRSNA